MFSIFAWTARGVLGLFVVHYVPGDSVTARAHFVWAEPFQHCVAKAKYDLIQHGQCHDMFWGKYVNQ